MSGNNNNIHRIKIKNKDERVIILVDMDCFFCQVEEKSDPELRGKPIAVVQHNDWLGGGIIAVNYAARDKGVTRHMRGTEAKERCPDIQLVKVPNLNQKADLGKYRDAGKEVAKVLQGFTKLLERASVDEAYLDVTESVTRRLSLMNNGSFVLKPEELFNTFAVGHGSIGEFISGISSGLTVGEEKSTSGNPDAQTSLGSHPQADLRLLVGASIANEIRQKIKSETGYECSAGIAHNKVCAKLACGVNKPNKQTIFPMSKVSSLFNSLPVRKIPGLGGKFGREIVDRLSIQYVGELTNFSESELCRHFDEKNGSWLYNVCRGIDFEPVTPRLHSKSIGCCKKFPGPTAITGLKQLNHWLQKLAEEVSERLAEDTIENRRRAKQMTLSFVQNINNEELCNSRSVPLNSYEGSNIAEQCLEVLKSNTKQFLRNDKCSALNNPICFLGISVGKFETIVNSKNTLEKFFQCQAAKAENKSTENVVPERRMELCHDDDNRAAKRLCLEVNSASNPSSSCSKPLEIVAPETTMTEMSSKEIRKNENGELNLMEPEENPLADGMEETELESETSGGKSEKSFEEENSKSTKESSSISNILEVQSENNARHNRVEIKASNTIEASLPLPENSFFRDIFKAHRIERESASNVKDKIEMQANDKDTKVSNEALNEATTTASGQFDINELAQTSQFPSTIPFLGLQQFKSCHICGERMLDDEFVWQIHSDKHFAEELAKEQRIQAKSQVVPKPVVIKPSTTKTSKQKGKAPIKNMSIEHFLNRNASSASTKTGATPIAPQDPTTTTQTTNGVAYKCKYCEMTFSNIVQFNEHEDYHLADLLQAE